MKKRCIGLLLVLCMVFALLPVFSLPASAAGLSTGQQNIIARAYQQVQIEWTPVKNVDGYINTDGDLTKTYYAGTTYSGIPYGQVPSVGKYVPDEASFDEFLAAVDNKNSAFYSTRGKNSYNGVTSTYYASDCSAFVSYAYGIGRMTTTGIDSSSQFSIVSDGIQSAQVGDCYNKPGVHVVLITGLTYNSSGKVSKVEISEQTPPKARTVTYSATEIESKYEKKGYTLLRFKNRDNVKAPETITYSQVPASPSITSYSSDASSVTLNWSSVSNASSYRVDFRKAGDEYATVKTGLTATSYTISGLTAGTKYYARVYAVNSAGTSPKQDGYAVWTKCDSPVITSALAKSSRSIVLTWGAVSGAASYTIAARWDDQEYVYLAEGVTGTSHTFNNLNPNTRYYFRVYAINEGGRSGRSETVSAQTLDSSLASATVTLPAGSYTYTGSAIQPKPTVKQNNITLTEGTDYTLSYSNNVNAGTATVTVAGKGNYSSTQSVNFTIQPKALTDSSIHSGMDDDEDGQWRYLGYPLTCALFDGNVRLKEGTDYTAVYTDNLNAGGTATATFVGKGNYTGTKVSTVKMVPRNINLETTFALSFDSADYTGTEIRPKATVVFDHNQDGVDLITLQEGTDYTLEYSNNVNPGTASVVVHGIGNYSGSKELSFQIVRSDESPFTDVPAGKFYTDAVLWAVSQNPQITNGYADGTFRPDQTCTRAQVVTFLWRANGCPEPKLTVNPFKDVSASAYYYKAVLWALENGITTGYSDGTFRPNDECTRAHVVTFLWRSEGSPEPVSSVNPFTDVSAGSYYAKAVLWALENGITTGKTPTTFNPDGACTRAHVVTFLYRDRA